MVRRKVYLEKMEGHIGANHLISAEDVGNSSGTVGSEFETVLLSDVLEAVHDVTRSQGDIAKKKPLKVLVVKFSALIYRARLKDGPQVA